MGRQFIILATFILLYSCVQPPLEEVPIESDEVITTDDGSLDNPEGTPEEKESEDEEVNQDEVVQQKPSPPPEEETPPAEEQTPKPPEEPIVTEVLAFPGAMGFGKGTRGAYASSASPKVIKVTNLNDSGSGSLREALESSGPRFVVFEVAGAIKLESRIIIKDDFLTVAGQTAPPPGIILTHNGFKISASEVIIRNIRVRLDGAKSGVDGIGIISPAATENDYNKVTMRNIILDHVSVSWATDENIGINGRDGNLENLTIQHSLVAEGLMPHSMGILINGHKEFGRGPNNISIIGNYFAANANRNPAIGDEVTAEVINNVIYGWRTKASYFSNDVKAIYGGNYFKSFPDTNNDGRVIEFNSCSDDAVPSEIYVYRNLGPQRQTELEPETNLTNDQCKALKLVSAPTFEDSNSQIGNPKSNYTGITKSAGAFPRDETDNQYFEWLYSGSDFDGSMGALLATDSYISKHPSDGYQPRKPIPTYLTDTKAILDSDSDGIPDNFELDNNMDPNAFDAHADSNSNGYTNLEDYTNSFFTVTGEYKQK